MGCRPSKSNNAASERLSGSETGSDYIVQAKHLEDGGSVVYQAILYQVKDVHSIGAEDTAEDEYLEGTIVKIFGIEVYNDVQ